MAGSMKKADLIHDLGLMLGEAKNRFEDSLDRELQLHLEVAAFDFARYRPRTKVGSISLVSGQNQYTAPSDYMRYKMTIWGMNERRDRRQWESNWPGRLPVVTTLDTDAGLGLYLDPAPIAAQLADFGSDFKFYYYAAHVIDDDATKTTIKLHDRSLFLIRALSASLTNLANCGVMRPVSLGDGAGSLPKNGTPAALADAAYKLFERMAS